MIQEDDFTLPLFQYANTFDCSNSLKRAVNLINNMIELSYIEFNNRELRFTDDGLQYVMNKHKQIIKDISGKNIDFGIFSTLVDQLKSVNNNQLNNSCTSLLFDKKNFLIPSEEDEIDYNNIVFDSKNKDTDEPFG